MADDAHNLTTKKVAVVATFADGRTFAFTVLRENGSDVADRLRASGDYASVEVTSFAIEVP